MLLPLKDVVSVDNPDLLWLRADQQLIDLVGIGMIPRGEVGLIFANIGLALTVQGERIIDNATFSAVVVMVIVTTVVTPPALKWSFGRLQKPDSGT